MGRRGRSKERTPEYFTVDVERLDQEGRGIAHLDGKVVFIQGALPGERVTMSVCVRNRVLISAAHRRCSRKAGRASLPAAPSSVSGRDPAAAARCSILNPMRRWPSRSAF